MRFFNIEKLFLSNKKCKWHPASKQSSLPSPDTQGAAAQSLWLLCQVSAFRRPCTVNLRVLLSFIYGLKLRVRQNHRKRVTKTYAEFASPVSSRASGLGCRRHIRTQWWRIKVFIKWLSSLWLSDTPLLRFPESTTPATGKAEMTGLSLVSISLAYWQNKCNRAICSLVDSYPLSDCECINFSNIKDACISSYKRVNDKEKSRVINIGNNNFHTKQVEIKANESQTRTKCK